MFITVNQEVIDKSQNNSNNNGGHKTFLKIEDGQQVFVQMMLDADAFVGYYRHTTQINGRWEYIHCADPTTCPCCQKKMARKLRTLVPMIVADDAKGTNPRIQIFDASINDVKEFYLAKQECEEESSDFLQTVFKFKRVGQKLDTTYRMTATRGNAETFKGGLDVKMPQWDKLIKFPTPQEVEAILNGGFHGAGAGAGNTQSSSEDVFKQQAENLMSMEDLTPVANDDMPF